MQNIQASLTIQQTYSSTLCTHVNAIYNRLANLEKQVQQHCMYPHSQTDALSVQEVLKAHKKPSIEEDDNNTPPGNATNAENHQETDWSDAPLYRYQAFLQ